MLTAGYARAVEPREKSASAFAFISPVATRGTPAYGQEVVSTGQRPEQRTAFARVTDNLN